MKQSLTLSVSQQLSLTPQLKQSLKLLQLSTLDLEQEIQTQLESNPMLERVEGVDETLKQQEIPPEHTPIRDNNIPQPVAEATDPNAEMDRFDTLAPEQSLEQSLVADLAKNAPSNEATTTPSSGENEVEYTQFVSYQDSLSEHLLWQLQMTNLSERDMEIGRTIIHCLDDDGYLVSSLEDISSSMPGVLEVETDEIEAVLSMVRSFEPAGVGAANFSERLSMLLQPYQSHPSFDLAQMLVTQYIDLLARRNYAKLIKDLDLKEEQLREALQLVTKLNPRIGARFSVDQQDHIRPDIIVKKNNGIWNAEINPENQLKLRVNESYVEILNKSNLAEQDSHFIQKHLSEAKMLIKGLLSRYDTLLLVGSAIVEKQQAFFEQGEEAMQPMVLADIASTLELHESTISRATAGKYLLSPRGVFELKYFFSSAVSNAEGTGSSSTAIRSLIRKMIDSECKTKPLSDSKIAKELEQQGHIVARRTVAKYRESLKIAPSSQRKTLN